MNIFLNVNIEIINIEILCIKILKYLLWVRYDEGLLSWCFNLVYENMRVIFLRLVYVMLMFIYWKWIFLVFKYL